MNAFIPIFLGMMTFFSGVFFYLFVQEFKAYEKRAEEEARMEPEYNNFN